jgi:hypothetical protein
VAVILLLGVLAGFLIGGRSGPPSSASGNLNTQPPASPTATYVRVDLGLTPRGWVPVTLGDAQISVPASWLSSAETCGSPYDGIDLVVSINPNDSCAPALTSEGVEIHHEPAKTSNASTTPVLPTVVVNGLNLYAAPYPPGFTTLPLPIRDLGQYETPAPPGFRAWRVPALQVEVEVSGALAMKVLHTLTYSPWAVAVAPGPAPSIPKSWTRISFGGLNVEVPSTWPVNHNTRWPVSCTYNQVLMSRAAVTLDTGAQEVVFHCGPIVNAPQVLPSPHNGLLIDPGNYGPLEDPTLSFGSCLKINGLTACIDESDPYGILGLEVHIPGKPTPVEVDIGLTGSGQMARTILYSVEKA